MSEETKPCKSGHIEWWRIAQAFGLKQPAGWFGWEKFEPDSVNRLADLIEPPTQCPYYHSDRHHCSAYDDVVDRDALLELAEEMDAEGLNGWAGPVNVGEYALRIREALGVER